MNPKITSASLVARLLAFAVLWILISGNAWSDWPLIAGIVVAATAASFVLWPVSAWRWRWRPFLRFLPYFLGASLAGGIDVAQRALSPKVRIDPALEWFPLRLRSEAARVFFAWAVSLLPGTASVRLEDARLEVHVLDSKLPAMEKLAQLESHVAAIFGEGD
ncbi:MAG: Na+/H+ antiporter subunit E [Verrucomicrobiales bacterium]